MSKVPYSTGKPPQGGNLGQPGPSAAKRQAARDRDREQLLARDACVACPYTHIAPARCAWTCAIARDTGTYDTRVTRDVHTHSQRMSRDAHS